MVLQIAKRDCTCCKCGQPIIAGTRYWSSITISTENGYCNEHIDCFNHLHVLADYLKAAKDSRKDK